MKQFLEWYLGIAPARPGQGTDWSLNYQRPWPSSFPLWLVLVLCLASIAYIGWVTNKDAHAAPLSRRVALLLLRLASLGVVLLALTEVSLVVARTGLPMLAIVLDDSGSMGLEDRYAEDADRKAAQRFAKASTSAAATNEPGSVTSNSRLSIAKGLLSENDGAFLKRLQAGHQLRVYRFAENASLLGSDGDGRSLRDSASDLTTNADDRSLTELLSKISSLKSEGTDSRPGEAIRKIINENRGSPPAAIIVISDGVTTTNDEDKLSTAAQVASSKLVPIYTVGVGTEESMLDLNLYDVSVDDVAFVNDPLAFTAKLKASGFKGKPVTVTLKNKDDRTPLVSKQVNAPEDGRVLPIDFTWTPKQPGDLQLVVEVTPLPSEVDKSNNSEQRQVSVREGRIRVLLVDSIPRWEYRELKFMLEREKTVELHTVLQDADLEFADQDVTAQALRGRFPISREQLNSYDVVIFGDVEPRQLQQVGLENLRDFVKDSGGGLIVVAGPQHTPMAYRDTPLETLLPVELNGLQVPSEQVSIASAFQPQLTIEGMKSTPLFRFDENEADSLLAWKRLPGLYWFVETPKLKPGAMVFVEHPQKQAEGRRLPIISIQRFGGGKVLFHATDETWQWRRRVGDLYYGRYWIQAIRYLSRSHLIGQAKQAELRADRAIYQRNENVNLRVRFFNEADSPATDDGVQVRVEHRTGSHQEVTLKRVALTPHVFEGQLPRLGDGSYHAWVTTPSFPGAPPSADFRVESPDRELRVRSIDRKELSTTATISRGRAYSLSTVDKLPAEIPPGKPLTLRSDEPVRLWNRWEVLFIFVTLLTAEWLLRKRLKLQ